MKTKELIEIAKDWDMYCDFFGGRNLETEEEFINGDIEERISYLIENWGDENGLRSMARDAI